MLLLVATFLIPKAQTNIVVEETSRAFSKGEQPSFLVTIPQAKLKEVEKEWIKYIRKDSKGKPETINGEVWMPGAVVKNISPDPINIYSRLTETQEGVILTAWIAITDVAFVSKQLNTDQDLAAQNYVRNFAVEQYKAAVKSELKDEQDKLKKLENELDGLIKDEEKSVKKISEHKRSIERNEAAIVTSKNDQKLKAEQVANQKRVVEQLRNTPGDAFKEAEKTLKKMEDEQRKLEKDNEKLNRDIDNWNKDIRSEERGIEKSKQDQRLKREEIEKQKNVVNEVQRKLNGIK